MSFSHFESEPRSARDVVGSELGPFTLRDVLGQGGSGVVYRAAWGHREVALKVLRSDRMSEKECERFLREAKRLADIRHPSVVKILNFGRLPDGRPYLAMELLQGEALSERLASSVLEPEEALPLLGELAEAVQALHDVELVHRDLKPENIFLVEGQRVILLDFGIAKELSEADSTVTQEGGIRGTPAYMAPERFFGEPASKSSDIYELAVCFFSMVSGQLPWSSAADPAGRLTPRRLSELGLELPLEVDAVLQDALSPQPDKRPSSAVELYRSLSAAMGQAPVSPAPRRTEPLPAAVAETESDVREAEPRRTEALGAKEPPPSERQSTTPHVSPSPKRRALVIASALALVVAGAAVAGFLLLGGEESQDANEEEARIEWDDGKRGAASATTLPAAPTSPPRERPKRKGDDSRFTSAARHLPGDAAFMMGLRWRELRQNEIFGELFEMLDSRPEFAPLRLVELSCDVDLLDDTDWLLLGGSKEREDIDLVASGDWTREEIEECLHFFADDAELEQDGDLSYYRDEEGQTVLVVAWLDDSAFVTSTRAAADEGWFRQRLLRVESSELLAVHDEQALSEGEAWLLSSASFRPVMEELTLEPAPSRLWGRMVLGEAGQGISLAGGLGFGTPEEAETTEKSLVGELEELRSDPYGKLLLSEMSLSAKGTDVLMSAEVSPLLTSVLGRLAADAAGEE